MSRREDDFKELQQTVSFASNAKGRKQVAAAVVSCAEAVHGLAVHDAPAVVAANRLVAEEDIGSADTLDTMFGVLCAAIRSNPRLHSEAVDELLLVPPGRTAADPSPQAG